MRIVLTRATLVSSVFELIVENVCTPILSFMGITELLNSHIRYLWTCETSCHRRKTMERFVCLINRRTNGIFFYFSLPNIVLHVIFLFLLIQNRQIQWRQFNESSKQSSKLYLARIQDYWSPYEAHFSLQTLHPRYPFQPCIVTQHNMPNCWKKKKKNQNARLTLLSTTMPNI